MGLRGQGWRRRLAEDERGYAMAALLVALAIMGILMSVAMPVWRQEARREKEAELIFRGEQYARAIALYRFKNANIPNAFPPSIDMLVEGRYLRKKYKDPMTKDGEFEVMPVGASLSMQPNNPTAPSAPKPLQPSPNSPVVGGIMGVRSKSEENSLRIYRGQTKYNQWAFTFNIAPRPGGIMPPANTPDGRGNDGRGGRGVGAPTGGRRGEFPDFGRPGGGGTGPRGDGSRRGGPGSLNPGTQPPTFPPFSPSGGRGRGR